MIIWVIYNVYINVYYYECYFKAIQCLYFEIDWKDIWKPIKVDILKLVWYILFACRNTPFTYLNIGEQN